MSTAIKWSIDDYHLMIKSGVLNNRVCEFIEGEIIVRWSDGGRRPTSPCDGEALQGLTASLANPQSGLSPESPLHRFTNDSIAEYLRQQLAGIAKVFESHPITLNNSEPEPDIAIVRLPNTNYITRHPYPEDIYWLIEISNTIEDDLNRKKRIYASAGINEYWIIDLKNTELIVFREPSGNNYKTKATYNSGAIAPLSFPDLTIEIGKMLNIN